MPKPLIIFDVDGTLIGGESYDWAAFDAAFKDVSGFNFPPGFFNVVAEVTGQAIVRRALPDLDSDRIEDAVTHISRGYAARLAIDIATHPEAFEATPGAVALLGRLTAQGYTCAIATGDWHSSISQKLTAAQIPWQELPMATCSDRLSRAEIISLAAERAHRPIHEAIYVGDGTWDLRATQTLNIPFIGCGKNIDRLKTAGARFAVPDLNPESFFTILDQLS